MSGARTIIPTIPIQSMVANGSLLFGVLLARPTLATANPSTSTTLGGSKIGGLKVEIPESTQAVEYPLYQVGF